MESAPAALAVRTLEPAETVDEGYSLQDVGRLLGLPRSIIRGLIDAGFVTPLRGPRREYRFSFQDLVVLRTAQALVEAKLPTTRILRSLRRLRTQLPPQMPLSGLRVEAVGDAVVVHEGAVQWQPHDGQYLLRFQVEAPRGRLAFLDVPEQPVASAHVAFERAMALEDTAPDRASDLYRQALAANPSFVEAYTNLGRLQHEMKRHAQAEATYRAGIEHCGRDETLLLNLALLLEEMRRPREAADVYRTLLDANPDLAQAHYNLALLCEAAGHAQEAIRHLAAYRRLQKR
jgi:tetratricopeptide (TPR) repeat protein